LNNPIKKIKTEITKKEDSITKPLATFNKLSKLKPAIKKYIDVRKKAKKVD
jgi:hypothetical protein